MVLPEADVLPEPEVLFLPEVVVLPEVLTLPDLDSLPRMLELDLCRWTMEVLLLLSRCWMVMVTTRSSPGWILC